MDSQFPFALLPEDVQLQVFLRLEAPDILRCRQVNKACYELANIPAVEYKVQLDLAGMVDNPSEGSPLIERHKKLLWYRDGWKNAILSSDQNVPAYHDFSDYRDWTGGVLPYIDGSQGSRTRLHLYRPGSSLMGLQPKKWIVEPGTVPHEHEVIGCGVDMAQDLLILSLRPLPSVPLTDQVLKLQFLSLQHTDVPHPLASFHVLRGPYLHTGRPNTRSIEICGDVVAWLFINSFWELQVWNWKVGTRLFHFRSKLFNGFALLNQSYLAMLPSIYLFPNKGRLVVYCIRSDVPLNSNREFLEPGENPDFILKLMRFVKGVHPAAYLSHSLETLGPDDVPPFKCNPDLSIFALQFDLEYRKSSEPRRRFVERFLLLASVRELVWHLDRLGPPVDLSQPSTSDPRILEWDQWGPRSTRLISLRGAAWYQILPTSGTRCAIGFHARRLDDRFHYVFLLNAHPHATLNARTTEGGNTEIVALFMDYDDTITRPDVLRRPVHTSLPITVTCRKVQKQDDVAPLSMGLFGGGLSLMFQPSFDGSSPGGLLSFYV